MSYAIKEIFLSLQGEGFYAGRVAVFCRFAGCNLWTGREADRAGALCTFCDTDFSGTDGAGGGVFPDAAALAGALVARWPADTGAGDARRFCVLTGGEPLLQLDAPLLDALHAAGFEVAVETNGTLAPPAGIDWTCVSPKAGAELVLGRGDELKLVWPQDGLDPARFEALEFNHFFLQPRAGPQRGDAVRRAVEYCLAHPRWRLSLQMHTYIGIP